MECSTRFPRGAAVKNHDWKVENRSCFCWKSRQFQVQELLNGGGTFWDKHKTKPDHARLRCCFITLQCQRSCLLSRLMLWLWPWNHVKVLCKQPVGATRLEPHEFQKWEAKTKWLHNFLHFPSRVFFKSFPGCSRLSPNRSWQQRVHLPCLHFSRARSFKALGAVALAASSIATVGKGRVSPVRDLWVNTISNKVFQCTNYLVTTWHILTRLYFISVLEICRATACFAEELAVLKPISHHALHKRAHLLQNNYREHKFQIYGWVCDSGFYSHADTPLPLNQGHSSRSSLQCVPSSWHCCAVWSNQQGGARCLLVEMCFPAVAPEMCLANKNNQHICKSYSLTVNLPRPIQNIAFSWVFMLLWTLDAFWNTRDIWPKHTWIMRLQVLISIIFFLVIFFPSLKPLTYVLMVFCKFGIILFLYIFVLRLQWAKKLGDFPWQLGGVVPCGNDSWLQRWGKFAGIVYYMCNICRYIINMYVHSVIGYLSKLFGVTPWTFALRRQYWVSTLVDSFCLFLRLPHAEIAGKEACCLSKKILEHIVRTWANQSFCLWRNRLQHCGAD